MRTFAIASYSLYFLAGLVITTIGSVMPQLLAHYEQSYTVGGQMVFVSAVGFIAGVPISAWLMKGLKRSTFSRSLRLLLRLHSSVSGRFRRSAGLWRSIS